MRAFSIALSYFALVEFSLCSVTFATESALPYNLVAYGDGEMTDIMFPQSRFLVVNRLREYQGELPAYLAEYAAFEYARSAYYVLVGLVYPAERKSAMRGDIEVSEKILPTLVEIVETRREARPPMRNVGDMSNYMTKEITQIVSNLVELIPGSWVTGGECHAANEEPEVWKHVRRATTAAISFSMDLALMQPVLSQIANALDNASAECTARIPAHIDNWLTDMTVMLVTRAYNAV